MKPCFYMVTYHRDILMAEWCLKSIIRFVRGDYSVAVGCPTRDRELAEKHLRPHIGQCQPGAQLFFFEEPEGKGFVSQECVKSEADLYAPGYSHYLHIDSDCLFTNPVNIEKFFDPPERGIWFWDSYENRIKENENYAYWRVAVERAVGIEPSREYMCHFPIVIPASVYSDTRARVARHRGLPFSIYVLSCKSSFPQTYAEFDTLGWVADMGCHEVAWRHVSDPVPWGANTLAHFWSHGGVDYTMPASGIPGCNITGRTMRQVATELGLV